MKLQGPDGAWEAELIWSPMVTAQYVILNYAIERQIEDERKRRILIYFRQTQREDGLWGFHRKAPPHLFVTTLVYLASRLLETDAEDPFLTPAKEFIQTEGVTNIPSWGKFWLAVMDLYKWDGLNPIIPELWHLPQWFPLHPSKWHCHARSVYMSMATIYANRFQVSKTHIIFALRDELYLSGFDSVDFSATRNTLRAADLFSPPNLPLRLANRLLRLYERFHLKGLRKRSLETISNCIAKDFENTDYAAVSPLASVTLTLALALDPIRGSELNRAIQGFDHWFWEDEERGARVAIHRTAVWDTSFAVQALEAASKAESAKQAFDKGVSFLVTQQIKVGAPADRVSHRTDPTGGWCLGRLRHKYALSDTTAEALLGICNNSPKNLNLAKVQEAVQFMLRTQNRDGGYGVYETKRTMIWLERLNPSEMFGDAMIEYSSVECTASCTSALIKCTQQYPEICRPDVNRAIENGTAWLRRAQTREGFWPGSWGINQIYGTLFGIKGLVASGAVSEDHSLRRASSWLVHKQRSDGSWGEHYTGSALQKYVPHSEGQVIQTAWALMALLLANEPNLSVITRGVQYLLRKQDADGDWPEQDPAGVFARTAVLEYPLYRRYFPLHALGLYAKRMQIHNEDDRCRPKGMSQC